MCTLLRLCTVFCGKNATQICYKPCEMFRKRVKWFRRRRILLEQTLQEQLAHYLSIVQSEPTFEHQMPQSEFFDFVVKLANSKRHTLLNRIHLIKKMFAALNDTKYLHGCRVKFNLKKSIAYMLDSGTAHFSMIFLHRASGGSVTKIVLHEIAHLWLSEREDYRNLRALDVAFRKYVIDKSGVDAYEFKEIEPIEFYATWLSILLMGAEDCNGLFAKEIGEETKKMRQSVAKLNTILSPQEDSQ